jgi:multidrug efflux pump subunit AcrA (membrane-fusion protein)
MSGPVDADTMKGFAAGVEFAHLDRSGMRLAFVLQAGKAERREVKIGAESEDFVEVVSGLRPGERVITGKKP